MGNTPEAPARLKPITFTLKRERRSSTPDLSPSRWLRRAQKNRRRERFLVVLQVVLYHGHRELEPIPLSLLGHGPVEIERSACPAAGRGDDPAVVADRNKDAQLYRELLPPARGQPPDTGPFSIFVTMLILAA